MDTKNVSIALSTQSVTNFSWHGSCYIREYITEKQYKTMWIESYAKNIRGSNNLKRWDWTWHNHCWSLLYWRCSKEGFNRRNMLQSHFVTKNLQCYVLWRRTNTRFIQQNLLIHKSSANVYHLPSFQSTIGSFLNHQKKPTF